MVGAGFKSYPAERDRENFGIKIIPETKRDGEIKWKSFRFPMVQIYTGTYFCNAQAKKEGITMNAKITSFAIPALMILVTLSWQTDAAKAAGIAVISLIEQLSATWGKDKTTIIDYLFPVVKLEKLALTTKELKRKSFIDFH
ncbi:MAG: hypothetical protein QG641_279 [Candidatus Poribacteria bacterium]|nr:hypothetical protein [Candidatus Poribacteria bacterium]